MRKALLFFLASLAIFSCDQKVSQPKSEYFTRIEIDTIITDNFSVRAILIENKKVWYASDKGKYGYFDLENGNKIQKTFTSDTKSPEFRSIASNGNNIFLLNVGSPALLYKLQENLEPKLVYTETHKNAFYDSMKFWNDKEGIAIGDPTDGYFSIIITRDGGKTWKKLSGDKLPKTNEGEAAFAASNTNLVVNKNDTWIVSGGKKARLFYSADKGESWEVYNTPIVQGEPMTGIFSADFYDENIGFLVGGNYDKPQQNSGNKALTINGGKTWSLISENSGFGYADCVQFVPDSGGKQLVTVGFSGINYSSDNGTTWKQMSSDKGFYTIRFINNSTAIAAGKGKIVKINFKK
jgi:photosystem II stability/assembly factor-like uncharacterized protein